MLVLPLLADPQLRPEQTMVLVVGPASSPISDNEQAVVTRLNDVRKQAGLTQLLLATMHLDQPTQARICREKLGITESDLICLAVVQLDLKTRRPVKTLYKVSGVNPASLEEVETAVRQWAAQSGVRLPAELGASPPLAEAREPAAVQGLDMNGDGKTDIFTVKEGRWLVSYSASEPYALLSSQPPVKLERMGFGDFDGDGKTDVFVAPEDGCWQVSPGGIGPLAQLNELKEGPRSLRFADLDGDGRTDVFNAYRSQWRYSPSGAQPWKLLQKSKLRAEEVALADFDGDGKADVFAVVNGVWKVSLGGTEPLTTWNPDQGNKFVRLRFGDFNGDGKADVFTELRHEWLLSDNGKTPLRKINQARGIGVADMGAGDFDGDKKADILVVKDGRWSLSSGGTGPLKAVNSDARMSIRDLRF
ncbi:VCBS repeat-containing protein [bacterium CPR1]|nr:VCBS repeat-containing protein [bacterium CPR1]